MGSSNSKSSSSSSSSSSEQQRLARKREALLREHGIFLPPVFAVGLDRDDQASTWWDSPSRIEAKYYDATNHYSATPSSSRTEAAATTGTEKQESKTSPEASSPTLPSSSLSLFSTTTSPSCPNSLSRVWNAQQEDPSYRIFYDYMTPGVWFQSISNEASVLASLLLLVQQDQDDHRNQKETLDKSEKTLISSSREKTHPTKLAATRGRLLVGRSLGTDGTVNVRLQGGTEGFPRLTSQIRYSDAVTIGMSTNQEGQGWLSGEYSTSLGKTDANAAGVRLEAVSVLPWDLHAPKSQNRADDATSTMMLPSNLLFSGSVGSGRNGWRLAADTKLNLQNLQTEETRLFGSINLQDEDLSSFSPSSSSSSSSSSSAATISSPVSPVQLSLELNEQVSAVALTQRIAFDRIHFNLADDRVPRVRNTVGWTIRMEQPILRGSTGADANADSQVNQKPRVSVGGVWQLNRALAVKANIQDEHLTAALIFKRWQHPRVTCSILRRYHLPSQTGAWLGIGVEIETGRFLDNVTAPASNNETAASNSNLWPGTAPPTEAVLPPEIKISK